MINLAEWKQINASDYFSDIQIPDTWDTLENFVDWYMSARMPMMIPWDSAVRQTDDATTICLFKKPPYQVEIYLIHENQSIPLHGHPGIEVITMLGAGGRLWLPSDTSLSLGSSWGSLSSKLQGDEVHGGNTWSKLSDGFCLYSFEKWPSDIKMTSAAIQWKGSTAGPIHDALISKHYPGAVTSPGYADVTGIKPR